MKFFLLLIFIVSCAKDPLIDSLTSEEQKNLEVFLREIMIENFGAYVLFGSKPLCSTAFIEPCEDPGHKELKQKISQGWQAWQKLQKDRKQECSRYILVKNSKSTSIQWPDGRKEEKLIDEYILADVKKVSLTLAKYYDLFRSIVKMDFHPFEVTFELEDPHSIFWNRLFHSSNQDPKTFYLQSQAVGLLFGFGEENALLFSWKQEAQDKEKKVSKLFSEPNDLDEEIFSFTNWLGGIKVPQYVSFDNGKKLKEYEREKKQIEQEYKRKNFLEITLQQMLKSTL